jgi:hypothetical protein
MNNDSESKPIKKPERNYFPSGEYKFTDEKPKPRKLALAPIDRTTGKDNNLSKEEALPPPKLSI